MATYNSIKGFKVQSLASDPSPITIGQMWYDTATDDLKYTGKTTAWTAAPNLNTGRAYATGLGTTSAALVLDGTDISPAVINKTEKYDGTSWTEVNTTNESKSARGSAGTTTAAIAFGGSPSTSATELYDGTTWTTSPTSLNLSRPQTGPIGQVDTAVLAVSGGYNSPPIGQTETWNGSSWTAGNNLQTPRGLAQAAAGTPVAGIAVGGDSYNPGTGPPSIPTRTRNNTEEYNGTTWTAGNVCNTARYEAGCVGALQTAAVLFGGASPGSSTMDVTETYDGTCWAVSPVLATPRRAVAKNCGGTSTAALCMGGNYTAYINVEEFGLGPTTKTVTVS